MKYIKTPVVYEKEDMTIWGRDGQWIATLALSWLAPELVTSINEHDKLVAERDALVGACEANVELHIHASECTECDIDGQCAEGERLLKRALDLRDAALALVRGEGEE